MIPCIAFKELERTGITVKNCPISNGLKTVLSKETFEKICNKYKEYHQKLSKYGNYTNLNFNCINCTGIPTEITLRPCHDTGTNS
jgi:hypothetical protein